ncbi:MAG: polyprenyl synthetase family protein [Deltaproteobacteria bacterium]|nr:polyprenyl synthetase family protein [Deltaproteobacteria bacterium]
MRIQEVFDLVKDDIGRMEEGFKKTLNSNVYLVGKVGDYILSSGGKRFRPMVLLLLARLCGCAGERHVPMAGVVEFIHTATLLHDDVVDNATLRRGNAAANTVWGDGASILVGDYLLSKAFALAVANGDMRILSLLSQTTTRMAEGEVLQLMRHSDARTTEEEYLEVVTNKTGVLISASAQIPAMLAGVSLEKEVAIANYGLNLGIAYQLMDDCLDYTSTDADLGKAVGNDLREGKVTMPLIHAIKNATQVERQFLKETIEAEGLTDERLTRVMEIIDKRKGIEYTALRASAYIEDAKRSLDLFEPDINTAALMAVADFVIERKY